MNKNQLKKIAAMNMFLGNKRNTRPTGAYDELKVVFPVKK